MDRIRQGFGVPDVGNRPDGGCDDRRSPEFFDRLEAGVAERLAAAPEPMQIPMAHVVLEKKPKAH